MQELLDMFQGWDKLDDFYPGAPDGPEISVQYGTKVVAGGGLRQQVVDLVEAIEALANSFPLRH